MPMMGLLAETGANPRKLLSLCDPQFPGPSCGYDNIPTASPGWDIQLQKLEYAASVEAGCH